MGSTGSSNESWPLSKDDYAEMYSPSRNDEDDDDANRNSTTEEERVSEEDDSWDQVLGFFENLSLKVVHCLCVGNLLLRQTFRRSSDGGMLKVPHLGPFEMCGIKTYAYPRYMALCKMQNKV